MSGIGTGTPIIYSGWVHENHRVHDFRELCSLLVSISGRADLDEPEESPKSRFWVNEGMRHVDSLLEFESRRKLHLENLSSGDHSFVVPNLRRVWQVSMITQEGSRELTLMHEDRARILRPDLGQVDSGCPIYYLLHKNTTAPSSSDLSEMVIGGTPFLGLHDQQITIIPKPSEAVSILVNGWFFEPYLVFQDDTNWIIEAMPLAVLYFALYHLERSYNNETGAQEWFRAAMLELQRYDREEGSRLTTRAGVVR